MVDSQKTIVLLFMYIVALVTENSIVIMTVYNFRSILIYIWSKQYI